MKIVNKTWSNLDKESKDNMMLDKMSGGLGKK